MANRIFRNNSQTIGALGKNINSDTGLVGSSSREFSNHSWKRRNTYVEQILLAQGSKKSLQTVWPDLKLGLLGAKDSRFPFPGNLGLQSFLKQQQEKVSIETLKEDKKRLEEDIKFWKYLCEYPSNHQRQANMIKNHKEMEYLEKDQLKSLERKILGKSDAFECVAHNCPDLLRKELEPLFGTKGIMESSLTAITICQKTLNDMSGWSQPVEQERDDLGEKFIKVAKDMCSELRKEGQWADFIDPSSGRPFYGPYTNSCMFETDEKFRQLGFRIVDLGCCKVISHHKWGTHSFVGSIFTSAPHDCESLQDLTQKVTKILNPVVG